MLEFAHVSLHQFAIEIFTIRLVRGVEILFQRNNRARWHIHSLTKLTVLAMGQPYRCRECGGWHPLESNRKSPYICGSPAFQDRSPTPMGNRNRAPREPSAERESDGLRGKGSRSR